jgi:rhamnulokinase
VPEYAAIDLGAESGRVVLGRFDGKRVALDVVHRFPNRPVHLPDGMRWNLLHLFTEALEGLRGRRPDGIGVDAWGVDYALLDGANRVLGLPFHYRDPRTRGMVELAHARVPRDELYAVTGIQTIPINTIFQLLADEGSAALAGAERIALVPDLFALWLTGTLANESTAASTTGLLDARTATWARDLIERLGLPAAPFAGDPVEPGTTLGPVLAHHEGIAGVTVHAVAGHDTASAFAAAPLRSERAAILSSGTWSLLGLELDGPVLDDRAGGYNLTNERGIEGTIRLLRNVMGLWLVQECRRSWARSGEPLEYAQLADLAAAAPAGGPLFDPDRPELLTPGDMPSRLGALCGSSDRQVLLRAIFESLACKYRFVLDEIERVTGRAVDTVHVIGGGARNAFLCRLTADVTRRTVLAGPVEAAALGNVLVQLHAFGDVASLDEMRDVVRRSTAVDAYEPDADGRWDELYDRFLTVLDSEVLTT